MLVRRTPPLFCLTVLPATPITAKLHGDTQAIRSKDERESSWAAAPRRMHLNPDLKGASQGIVRKVPERARIRLFGVGGWVGGWRDGGEGLQAGSHWGTPRARGQALRSQRRRVVCRGDWMGKKLRGRTPRPPERGGARPSAERGVGTRQGGLWLLAGRAWGTEGARFGRSAASGQWRGAGGLG